MQLAAALAMLCCSADALHHAQTQRPHIAESPMQWPPRMQPLPHEQPARPREHHNALEHINVAALHATPDPKITLKVNSTKLKRSGDWFEVSWSGVPSPDWGDVVALMPAAADPIWSAAPLKYDIAGKAKSHVSRGSGKLR